MEEVRTGEEQNKHDKYNEIPVAYCADCLSLGILTIHGIDYCEKCGSTNIEEANIFDWEKLYKTRYSGRYLNEK